MVYLIRLQAASSPPPAAAKSFTLEQQLKDAWKNFKEADNEIYHLRIAKPEDWQREVEYLCRKMEQLHEEMELLRKLVTEDLSLVDNCYVSDSRSSAMWRLLPVQRSEYWAGKGL